VTSTGPSSEHLNQRGFDAGRIWPKTTASSMVVGFTIALMIAALTLAVFGTEERGTAIALRFTARWSFVLFWLAYIGGAMARLFGGVFATLARRGRDFGLAYASAQVIHVGLVLWIFYLAPDKNGGMVFFWAGIACTYMLALLSLPKVHAGLAPRLWRLFRTIALEYIALVFAADFIFSPLSAPHPGKHAVIAYLPFVLMLVGGEGLRVAAVALDRRPADTTRTDTSRADSTRIRRWAVLGIGAGGLILASTTLGLWDLFRGPASVTTLIALAFVTAGIFNSWGALRSN
jgi:hypothetical protein